MAGRDKSKGHGKEQAGSNQARRRRRRNIEEPASSTDYKAKKKSYDRSHHFPLLKGKTIATEIPPIVWVPKFPARRSREPYRSRLLVLSSWLREVAAILLNR